MRNKNENPEVYVIRNRLFRHLLFWALSFYVLCRIFAYEIEITKVDVIYTFLFHLSLWFAVYTNLLWLIPRWFRYERYLPYLVGLLGVILISVGFNIITFNWLADLLFPGYYFIAYYEFWDILQFIVVYLAVTTLLKLSKSWFDLQRSQRQLSKMEKEKLDAELSALKAQVNPHFLFNSLNNLYSLALDEDKRVPAIILRLSAMMRYLLYETNVDKVPLSSEIEHLENYVELQRLRVGERASIKFNVKGKQQDQLIAPLLLLPLVENSFKHGVKGETEAAFVDIILRVEHAGLVLTVENNKGVTDEVEAVKSRGVGLQNLRRRLELLYPGRHQLIVSDGVKTFTVKLSIDL